MGARRRWSRTRTVLASFVVVAVTCVCTSPSATPVSSTMTKHHGLAGSTPPTPEEIREHEPRLAGWVVSRTISVPSFGSLAYGHGAVWVVDAQNLRPGEMRGDHTGGILFEIDPYTGEVLDKIANARGGLPVIGQGAIWLCTLLDWAVAPDVVSRVDFVTHTVSHIRTSTSDDAEPEGIVLARGHLWVANNFDGQVAEIDPSSRAIVRIIPVGRGVRGAPATDGTSVWFGVSDPGVIVRIDARSGKIVSTLALPRPELEGLLMAHGKLYASTPGHVYEIDVSDPGSDVVTRDLVLAPKGGPALGMAWGFGSLWAIRSDPGELLEVDPDAFRVSGRMRLGNINAGLPAADALAIGARAIWIRTPGRLLELRRIHE